MTLFMECMIYLAAISISAFLIGRIVPKRWFFHDRFPYRMKYPEKETQIYQALGVRMWKACLPDMSELLPNIMPSKKLPKEITLNHLEIMIQETCIAEGIHRLLVLMGFGCVLIWRNVGGWIMFALYALGNLPYIIIQRFNRPKLLRLLKKIREKEMEKAAKA